MSYIKRPAAAEWHQHLTEILENQGLSRCERFPSDFRHIRFTGKTCPQCHLENLQSLSQINTKNITGSEDLQDIRRSGYQSAIHLQSKNNSKKSVFGLKSFLTVLLLVAVGFLILEFNVERSVASRPTDSNWSPPTAAIYDAAYLNNPAPRYPPSAFREKAEGTVIVRVEILANGKSGRVELQTSSGFDSLDDSALSTIKKWQFNPATVNGKRITQWVTIPITFRLTKRGLDVSTPEAELSVATIQQYLRKLGFDPGPIDGILGTKTRRAIQEFQISQGLAGEGLITPSLERELRSRVSALQN